MRTLLGGENSPADLLFWHNRMPTQMQSVTSGAKPGCRRHTPRVDAEHSEIMRAVEHWLHGATAAMGASRHDLHAGGGAWNNCGSRVAAVRAYAQAIASFNRATADKAARWVGRN